MTRTAAGVLDDLIDGRRHLLEIDGREVAVFAHRGHVYAYENTCAHQGGPVGEGMIIGRVEAVLDEQRRLVREEFDDQRMQIVCPWHGWAYDLETGVCAGLESRSLRRYRTEVDEGVVYVRERV